MTACCYDEWASSYWKKYYCVPYMRSVGKGLHHKENLQITDKKNGFLKIICMSCIKNKNIIDATGVRLKTI